MNEEIQQDNLQQENEQEQVAEKQFEAGNDIPEKQKSFWDKYKILIFYGAIGTALVLGGVAYVANQVKGMFQQVKYTASDQVKCTTHNWQSGTFSSGCHYCGRRYGGGMFYKCKKCGIIEYSGNTTVHCSCEGALNSRRRHHDVR